MFSKSKYVLFSMCVVVLLFSAAKASYVHFETSPNQLKSNLTEDLSMRCSVTDGLNASGAGRSDVKQLISIYVTYKDHEDVASVTSTEAPISYVEPGNLESKGSISATSGEGFLQLSWRDPSQVWVGEYNCTVVALDNRGHIVQMTSRLTLTAVAPSLSDLMGFFRSKIQTQNEKIESLEKESTNNKQENAKLKNCLLQKVAFTVAFNGTGNLHKGSRNHALKFDQIIMNEGGDYDVTTGLFKCKTAGLYVFSVHVMGPHDNHVACVTLQQNDVKVTSARTDSAQGYDSSSTSAVLRLQAGDSVGAYDTCGSYVYQDSVADYRTNIFSGHLISPDQCV